MRKPEKSDVARRVEGKQGGLGNIDEQRGHPGKGTGGQTTREAENPDPAKREPESAPEPRRD